MQLLLTRLFPKVDQLESIEKLSPWLCRGLHNLYIDSYRLAVRQSTLFDFESDGESVGSDQVTPVEHVSSKELIASIDAAAIALFEKIRESAVDERFGLLAQKQIAKLRSRESKSWFGYASAGYGYDSNITAQPSSNVSGEASTFAKTLALFGWKLSGSDTDGIHSLARQAWADRFLILARIYKLVSNGLQVYTPVK